MIYFSRRGILFGYDERRIRVTDEPEPDEHELARWEEDGGTPEPEDSKVPSSCTEGKKP